MMWDAGSRRCARAGGAQNAPAACSENDDADASLNSALRCAQLTENFAEIVDASAHLMALATAP